MTGHVHALLVRGRCAAAVRRRLEFLALRGDGTAAAVRGDAFAAVFDQTRPRGILRCPCEKRKPRSATAKERRRRGVPNSQASLHTKHYENPASLRFHVSKTRVAATSSPAARTSASQTNKPRFDGASLHTSSTSFPTGDASK